MKKTVNRGKARLSDRMEVLYMARRLAKKRHISEGSSVHSAITALSKRRSSNSAAQRLAKNQPAQAANTLCPSIAAVSHAPSPWLPKKSRYRARYRA